MSSLDRPWLGSDDPKGNFLKVVDVASRAGEDAAIAIVNDFLVAIEREIGRPIRTSERRSLARGAYLVTRALYGLREYADGDLMGAAR